MSTWTKQRREAHSRRMKEVWAAKKAAAHQHRWKMVMHLDGCHFYTSSYSCECGATASAYDERDVEEDAWSAIWMEDTGEEPCLRCQELLAGAEAKHSHEIVEKK